MSECACVLTLVSEVELQVWREGDSLQLLFLDCDASHPSQLEHTALHPLIVYIHISRVKVWLQCAPSKGAVVTHLGFRGALEGPER